MHLITLCAIKEYRSFDFRPEISAGHQFDPFIVPNVPFMTAAWELARDPSNFMKNIAVKAVLLTTSSRPFVVCGVKKKCVAPGVPSAYTRSKCAGQYFIKLIINNHTFSTYLLIHFYGAMMIN